MRIALLHLESRAGDLAYNCRLLETGIAAAAAMGAEWLVTPELYLSGYEFQNLLGTDWIVAHPDPWVERFRNLAAGKQITLFLSHPERDSQTGRLYNSVFVIGTDGRILGTHRKICVIPGVEAWASRGETATPVLVPPLSVGILICADAYTAEAAGRLHDQGAQLLVSSAAWAPRPHGPERCWEERTRETGLPLFVCNRTGKDQRLNFGEAESVVVHEGERLISFSGSESTVLLIDWNVETNTLADHAIRQLSVCPLCGGPNGCGLTCDPASAVASCWCFDESFPPELLDKVPPEALNRRCICLECVRSFRESDRVGTFRRDV